MGHRYYDPGAGRFITRDPIGSGTNWYRYADNNPLQNVDPSGLYITWQVADDEESQRMAMEILYWLFRIYTDSQSGSALAAEVLFGDQEYVIDVNSKSVIGNNYDSEKHKFHFSETTKSSVWSGDDGYFHDFTWMRIVAHELGHVMEGDEQKNVDDYENTISDDLGDPRIRVNYWNGTIKKIKVPKGKMSTEKLGGGDIWRRPTDKWGQP